MRGERASEELNTRWHAVALRIASGAQVEYREFVARHGLTLPDYA
jgi:hypothetical protein